MSAVSVPGVQAGHAGDIRRVAARLLTIMLVAAFLLASVSCVVRADELDPGPAVPWAGPAGRLLLDGLGLPSWLWAGGWAALEWLVVGVSLTASWLIVRGEATWFRCYVAIALVSFATLGSNTFVYLGSILPALLEPARAFQGIAWIALFPIAYVFPDGRFVPRWTRWVAPVWPAYLGLAGVAVLLGLPEGSALELVLLAILFATCAFAQVHRYRRVADEPQRRQVRWLLLAFVLWLGYALTWSALGVVTPLHAWVVEPSARGLVTYATTTVIVYGLIALIPTAVTVAIVRHRLYDIDVWVSRTLVYVVLTVFVIGSYTVIVGGIGLLVPTGQGTVLPIVATVVVALAFAPVRSRVQRRVQRAVYGDRSEPYAVLARLGRQLSETIEVEEVPQRIADATARALNAPYVAVETGDQVAAASGRGVPDVERVPITHRGQPIGWLAVGLRRPRDRLTEGDRTLLRHLADSSGAALYAVRDSRRIRSLNRDLLEVRRRLVTAREEERRQIRRDLHDSLGAALGGQALTIDSARALVPTDPETAQTLLADLKFQNQGTLDEVRRLARDLRPPSLDELGLRGALEHLAETHRDAPVSVSVDVPVLPALPAAVEVAAYRIAQEAATNVARHARAKHCLVTVAVDEDLRITVRDDGRGAAAPWPAGVGTQSMRERAEELGGTLTITTSAAGTEVLAVLPLQRAGDEA